MNRDSSLHKGLKEKYFHSRGAVRSDEGKFTAAVRYYKKALMLDNQAYTHADLSHAYTGKDELRRAIDEISRAIALTPRNAEYRLQRSTLWNRIGEMEKAEADHASAQKLDPTVGRIELVRKALTCIEEAFGGNKDEEPRSFCHSGLSRIIQERAENRKMLHDAVDCQSCIVPCPGYCCHFSKDTLLHGLFFGAWKLHTVRKQCKEMGMEEEHFLARFSITNADRRLRLIPPDRMLPEAGQIHVYFPKRGRKPLGQKLAKKKPMGRYYSEISWITKESRPCAFLSAGKCIIHDTGGEAALSSCKEFLCLTGFIFLVLDHLMLIDRNSLEGRDVAELNNVALEAALLLSSQVFEDRDLVAMERDLGVILDEATNADASGDELKCNERINRYYQLQRTYHAHKALQIEKLKSDVRLLLVH
jgi:tetratricopeptide (TPR) repeat protein